MYIVLFNIFSIFNIYFTNVNDYYLFCKLKNNAKDLNLIKNIKMYYTYLFKKNIKKNLLILTYNLSNNITFFKKLINFYNYH